MKKRPREKEHDLDAMLRARAALLTPAQRAAEVRALTKLAVRLFAQIERDQANVTRLRRKHRRLLQRRRD